MEGDSGEYIYRALMEDNGLPKLGASASTLGTRRGKDSLPDQAGKVHRPAFHPRDPNGLSCAPNIQDLPHFALPVAWGGTNQNTVVWKIAPADLGTDLIAQEDPEPGGRRRVSIGPSATMTCDDYEMAIQATQPKWPKVNQP